MSYGTMIFPKIEDFPEYCNLDNQNLADHIDSEVRIRANKFVEFRALSLCTPYNVFGDKAYDKITKLVSDYFNDYVESYILNFNLSSVLDLKEQASYITEGETHDDGSLKRPYLYFNGYTFYSIYEAKEAVSGIERVLTKLKGKIIGICLATPIDITPRDQEKYVDGHEEPLLYLETELDNIEETLDDYLKDICTIKLIIKYWDGHKEG